MSYNYKVLWQAKTDRYLQGIRNVHFSNGNAKLGIIPSFSLLPGVSCSAEACATCLKEGCYACKNALCHGYNIEKNNCLRAWAENTVMAKHYLPQLERELNNYFDKLTAPAFFRIHVSGDFISLDYLKMWKRVIIAHSRTRFLVFTKQFDYIRQCSLLNIDNCSPVLSGWTGCEIPQDLIDMGYRVAWCDDGEEDRIPDDALACPGNCDSCGMCWNLYSIGRDVKFHKH